MLRIKLCTITPGFLVLFCFEFVSQSFILGTHWNIIWRVNYPSVMRSQNVAPFLKLALKINVPNAVQTLQ